MPKLLSINNYYYRRGGAESVFFDHNSLLERAGWEVIPFAMQHAENEPSAWSDNFAKTTDGSFEGSPIRKISRAITTVYSSDAARRIRRVISATRPSLAHAHNIYHHLSPSVLVELRRNDIPIVMTLHDLKLVCPAYKMHTQGAVCERCRGGALRNVIVNRCIKNSLSMSALVWLESTIHRALNLYMGNVSRFVVPSRFFLRKFAEWGVDTSRFVYIPNFVDADAMSARDEYDDAFVYFGRLSSEKGIATLIRAAAQAKVPVRIVGTGPEESSLRLLAAQSGADVQFTGYLTGKNLRDAIASARAVVIPSEWYENAPLSIMEASALGRPTIGAKIGGIPELIREGETGFVFDSGSVDSLAKILGRVGQMPISLLRQFGFAGREWMRAEFSAAAYRMRMLKLYDEMT
ncbi:MAG: glycosyltransferase [Pseudomonadota bacterium]|nr:glycosyltransferase [Pseudomonadota bacterium]